MDVVRLHRTPLPGLPMRAAACVFALICSALAAQDLEWSDPIPITEIEYSDAAGLPGLGSWPEPGGFTAVSFAARRATTANPSDVSEDEIADGEWVVGSMRFHDGGTGHEIATWEVPNGFVFGLVARIWDGAAWGARTSLVTARYLQDSVEWYGVGAGRTLAIAEIAVPVGAGATYQAVARTLSVGGDVPVWSAAVDLSPQPNIFLGSTRVRALGEDRFVVTWTVAVSFGGGATYNVMSRFLDAGRDESGWSPAVGISPLPNVLIEPSDPGAAVEFLTIAPERVVATCTFTVSTGAGATYNVVLRWLDTGADDLAWSDAENVSETANLFLDSLSFRDVEPGRVLIHWMYAVPLPGGGGATYNAAARVFDVEGATPSATPARAMGADPNLLLDSFRLRTIAGRRILASWEIAVPLPGGGGATYNAETRLLDLSTDPPTWGEAVRMALEPTVFLGSTAYHDLGDGRLLASWEHTVPIPGGGGATYDAASRVLDIGAGTWGEAWRMASDDYVRWTGIYRHVPVGFLFAWTDARGDHFRREAAGIPPVLFRRGDANADAETDLSDAVRIFLYLFVGGNDPPCLSACDADDSGAIDITDGIYLLGWLFLGDAAPSAPLEECGPDPTPEALGCASFAPCG